MAADLLTVDTVGAYVRRHIDELDSIFTAGTELLTAEEITGGNLNFAFRVKDGFGKSVFVKQAPDFIKVFGPEAKLHRERMELEVNAYREWESVLGEEATAKFLPKILHFDIANMVFIMEDLVAHELLDKLLFEGIVDETVAGCVGEFMGVSHAGTHSTKIAAERVEALTKAFENAKLRDIQLEYVFTKAFRESERAKSIFRDDAVFMEELEKLKALYRGECTTNLALTHGDLHPGSVMVLYSAVDKVVSAKIIDPEFAIYGPPGLDLGSLLSGHALAYIFHLAMGATAVADSVLVSIERCWSSYSAAMATGGIHEECLAEIADDAVGFAACEVARTSLGFAGVRGLPIKGDETLKARAE
jgi:5-methylthioribose kinase